MIEFLLGFLAMFGTSCCGNCTDEELMLYDCDHQWEGEDYDLNGDGVVGVDDLFIGFKIFNN